MSFIDHAYEAIRESGGRITPQRRLVIELLASATDRLDAEGLYEFARAQDDRISLATVYRTLSTLEAAGLIRQRHISRDHERKYYEPVTDVYHFTCRRCRHVITFNTTLVDALRQQLMDDYDVHALNVCVCVDGLCPQCHAELTLENAAKELT